MESKETQTERKLSCLRQFFLCIIADESFRLQRLRNSIPGATVNSVSGIDKISRVLFPLSFLILNIVYWYIYTNMNNECPIRSAFTRSTQKQAI